MNKLQMMLPIGIGIMITIIVLTISLNSVQKIVEDEDLNKENTISEGNNSPIIQERLDEIKKNKLENPFTPRDREWITSGPFQIDRSEYLLGEKVFIRMGGIQSEEKGEILFMRPLNNTHHSLYLSIPFNGAEKNTFNFYMEPKLSMKKEICSVEDILGKWFVVFKGTQYENLSFNIINEFIPGEEDDYVTIC